MSTDRRLALLRRVDALSAAQRQALAGALVRDGLVHTPERLVGFIVPSGDVAPSDDELRAWLAARVPDYMIPARFVGLAQLPRTAAGKLDRRALAEERGLELTSGTRERPTRSPRTDVEQTLAAIWMDVLKIDEVGVDDDFFELGGDSLLSIRVIGRAGREGIRISPERFFEQPTIAHMAASVASNGSHSTTNGTRPSVDAVGDAPLTPIQHWFLDAIRHHRDWWNQSYLLELGHELTDDQLRPVVNALVRHHDALRLRLVQRDGEWRQHFAAHDDQAPFRSVNLVDTPREQYASRVEDEGNREQASLRIADGRLFRCIYFHGAGEWRRVLLLGHHLVLDGVSWGVILEDFATLVGQAVAGQTLQLPAKTASARAWASALATQASLPETIESAKHWLAVDTDATTVSSHSQTASNTNRDAAVVVVSLGADDSRALVQDAPRRFEASAQAVLLAALLLAWQRWTGHDGLRLDVEGHGRNVLGDAMDASRTVGWFTTVFPVQLRLATSDANGEEGAADRVVADVQAALDALPLGGAGHGLVRYLAPNGPTRASLSAQPRPDVLFNYLGAHDVSLHESSRLRVTDEPHGRTRSAEAPRAYVLEINARLEGGELIAVVEYSSHIHGEETMARFATHLRESLLLLARRGDVARAPYGLAQLDATALATVADLLSELDDA